MDDLELQKMLILDGHGVGAFPLLVYEEELRSGGLITISKTLYIMRIFGLLASIGLFITSFQKFLLRNSAFMMLSPID